MAKNVLSKKIKGEWTGFVFAKIRLILASANSEKIEGGWAGLVFDTIKTDFGTLDIFDHFSTIFEN